MNDEHPISINISPDALPDEIAIKLSGLRYDKLAEVMKFLYEKINSDADADGAVGRHELAIRLSAVANHMGDAGRALDEVWKICEPHMKDEPE